MPNINITVAKKIATNTTPGEVIVCGNSDYKVVFAFDAEWSTETNRVARFCYYKDGLSLYRDVEFTGNTAAMPILHDVDYVLVGVYAGRLRTTTPAKVLCDRSILCGDPLEAMTPAEKAKLREQIGDLNELETVDKSNLVAAVNEVRNRLNGMTEEQVEGLKGIQPTILALGDSICEGLRNGGKGFVGELGLPYINRSLSGSVLSSSRQEDWVIFKQLVKASEAGVQADIVIADGGVNDYYFNIPKGEAPTEIAASEESFTDDVLATVLGGLQKLFFEMWKRYPEARKLFVLTHKTSGNKHDLGWCDWTTTTNAEGYTQESLFEEIRKTCAVYKIEIVDVYAESGINTADEKYRSNYTWDGQNGTSNEEFLFTIANDWVDSDGIHPFAYGYTHGYLPIVHKAIFGTAEKQIFTVVDGLICIEVPNTNEGE